ncbi:M1 family aminopeptidase [Flavobacterium antarcticum]|uniref:M1 family aminopeptidase n=1 Tax=Flavobacterium antarcticum TaxID=271155 RepID=UPI0003B481FB|nr:M1 family aminopeptidase [Flavobacterium antarcticum]
MKKIFAFALMAFFTTTFAQTTPDLLHKIAEAEMKSASATMNFAVNPNTLNYDITYQKLEFAVDPAVYFINGKVTTTFKALSSMSTVTFDLTNDLTVSSVKQNNVPLTFSQSDDQLQITLQNTLAEDTLAEGTLATVEIIYSGAPSTTEQAFTTSTHANIPVLYTLSEPYGARDWWPCKQDMNDKTDSIDIYITAPSQYVSVANGLELSQITNLDGTKTTHFSHGYPIPAYLVAIAVTNYQILTQTAGTAPNTFPIVNYLYPENFASASNSVAVTLPIMNLFETLFETYPYADEKYGHAQFGWGGGMEHTTVSFMGSFERELIAHELGHQWFGDKITCGSWNDIWLNEGFANYMYGLVVENLDGNNQFRSWKNSLISNITSQNGGSVYVPESQISSVNRIFSSRLTYNKGAMVVHMLRFKLGDTNFFQGVKNYLADTDLAYGYAETSDLKAHLETVSGLSLTEFFDDWIYGQGYPSYQFQVANLTNNQVKITVNQTQSHSSVSFFEMPVPLRLIGANGQQLDVILNNINNNQSFIESVPFTVTSAIFDPEKQLISKNNQVTLDTIQVELNSIMRLYPNPTSSLLKLQLPNDVKIEKVLFYNTLGQIISTSTATSWDVSGFANGVYYLKVFNTSGTKTFTFIKA